MHDRSGAIPQIFILKAHDGSETVIAHSVISDPEERVYPGAIVFFRQYGLRQAFEVSDITSRAEADGGGYVVSVVHLGPVA